MASRNSAASLDQGTFDVDGNGQATYGIPLRLPQSIGSYQPKLSLLYSHRSPNGLLGVGWNLAGLSVITRTKATYAVDGFNGAITYGPDDRFTIDGQRLIHVQGEYGAGGTLYYTEIQTWQRVLAGATPSDGFTVRTKDGQTLEYGKTQSSRILATGTSLVRVWALNAKTDRNGNRIEFDYTPDPGGGANSGAYYISAIRYTKRNGLEPQYLVQFGWEQRPDVILDHVGGYPVTMAYRLRSITISLSGGEVIRTYTIGYDQSNATGLSRITVITESGAQSDGSLQLPPATVVWQDVAQPGFDINPASVLDQHPGQPDLRPMDLTGSGRTDFVQLWTDVRDNTLHATSYIATVGAGGTTFVRAGDTSLDAFPATNEILPVDVDGDGMTDLVVAYQNPRDNELCFEVFLSDGSGGFTNGGTFHTGDVWDTNHIQFLAIDANGDGRTDIVESYAYFNPNLGSLLRFRSYLSKFGDGPGQMFTQGIVTTTGDPARPTNLLATWGMDLNGDGMIDIVRVWQRQTDQHIIATSYVSVSKGIDDTSFSTQLESDLGTFSLANVIGFQPVDVNGDGVQDLLEIWQEPGPGTTTLHLTTFLCNGAGGFVTGPESAFPNQSLSGSAFYPMDVDGHGLTAIVGKWISGDNRLQFTVYRASQSGQYTALPPFDAGVAGSAIENASFFPSDVNGDGKADLVRVSFDQNDQIALVPYTSAGPYPDLASTITNQLGGVVALQYAPLSDGNVYGPGTVGSFPAGQGRRFANPMTPAQFPVQAVLGRATYVVSRYTLLNDPALNRFAYGTTMLMSYAGAQLNLLGRGWQGFNTVASLSQETGQRTVQTFNQDFPFTGTSAATRLQADGRYATDPRVPNSATDLLLAVTTSEYEQVVRARGAGDPQTPIVDVLKQSSRYEQYDYGTFDYAIAQTFAYDDYGNETLNVYLGYVDPGTRKPLEPAEVVYKYRRYRNDADAWALGFLIASKVSANADDPDITKFFPGDYHLETQTWTDDTFDVKTRSAWDSGNDVFLTTSYEYDEYGNCRSETTPGNLVTTYDYDPVYHAFRMRSTSPKDAQGTVLVSTYGYDPRFAIQVANCDPNGSVTIAALDGFGRVIARQGPLPRAGIAADTNLATPLVTGSPELRQTFQQAAVVTVELDSFLDDGQGGLYSQAAVLQSFPTDSSRDFIWNQRYVDGRSRERETVRQTGQSAGNAIVLTNYGAGDKVAMKSLPFFSPTSIVTAAPHAATMSYDVLGRPIVQNAPAGPHGNETTVTTWTYGRGGKVMQVSAAGSSSPYTQLFEHHLYNGVDKVRSTTLDPGGANATSTFRYDGVARLLQATDPPTSTSPGGVSNTMTFDSLDRRLTVDNPDQNTTGDDTIKAMTYVYDAVTGWLQVTTDAAGENTTYGYDNLGRMTSKATGDGRTFVYTYDIAQNGKNLLARVVARRDDGSVESQYDFAYDPYGNITTSTVTVDGEASPFVTTSVFDPQNRVVQQTFPDATVLTRAYSFGQLVSQSLDGATTAYPLEQYSAWQKPGRLQDGNGVVSDLTFNPLGQVFDESVRGPAGTLLHYDYSYDLLGQMLSQNDILDPSKTQSFTYLDRRLATANVLGFDSGSYGYDASGNLQSKDGVSFTYQAHYPVSGTAGGQSVYVATPDACGRTRSRTIHGTTVTFDYDGLGFLRRVRNANGDTIRENVSNYLARLLRETDAAGNVTLYISAAYLVTRTGGNGSVTKYLLDEHGTAASIVQDGSTKTILYFRRDFKGSMTHAFGSGGTVVTEIAYDGYGRPLVVSGTEDFRPKYEQREWDADLGLYYFGARFYDAFTGRFLTPDSRTGSDDLFRFDAMNRFAFELNNPINNVDPSGNSVGDVVGGILIGLLFIAVAIAIVATAGTATPVLAVAVGISAGAGLNAVVYSATHTDVSGGRFWGGFVVSTLVGAVIGGVTAGAATAFGSVVESATVNLTARLATVSELGVKIAVTGARAGLYVAFGSTVTLLADMFNQFMSNVIDKEIIGKEDVRLDDGLGRAAVSGVIFGALAGLGQAAAEFRYLRVSKWNMADVELLDTRPVPMTTLPASTEESALLANTVRTVAWTVENTLVSRAVLFGVSLTSMAGDAIVESVA